MPGLDIRDPSRDERVLDKRRVHIERVEAFSYGGDVPRSNSGTRGVREPAPIPIEVGNEFLRPGAENEDGYETNRGFWHEEGGLQSDLYPVCEAKVYFAYAC